MSEVHCINGIVYRDPGLAYAALKENEAFIGRTQAFSIYQCPISKHYHLKHDYGQSRDIACSTKRTLHSKSQAKAKLKEMHRAGRRDLVLYSCWYSDDWDDPHYHLGHPAGQASYYRPGRIFG